MKRFGKAVKKGFTLVELVIVIAVIAVLSAVLIPTFGGILSNAKVTAMNKTLNSLNSDLLSRALIDNITYYTPDAVRGILEEKNYKAEDIPEGYSVWYNQKTCNLTLKKDADVFSGSSASVGGFDEAGIKTVKADGGSIDFTGVDRLPRRPEALSADKNELVLYTPNANISDIINTMYNIANSRVTESGIDESSFNNVITEIKNTLNDQIVKALGTLYGGETSFPGDYISDFNPDTTIYVTSDGYMYTNAIMSGNSNVVRNVVFCKDENTGNSASTLITVVKPNSSNPTAYVAPKMECPLELPASTKTIKPEVVNSFNFGAENITVIVRAEVDTSEISGLDGVTIVSTKRGDSTTGGGTTSPVSYIGYDQMKGSLTLEEEYTRYYTRAADGFISDATGAAGSNAQNWLLNEESGVAAKFAVPTFSIDLGKAMSLVGLTKDNLESSLRTVNFKDQAGTDYRTFFFVATYEVTENNTAKMKGVRFDTRFGYITNVSDYISSGTSKYTSASSTTAAADFGDFKIVVPSAAKSFVNYEGFKVCVDYYETSRYYEKGKDIFGKEAYKYRGSAWNLVKDVELTSKDQISFTLPSDKTSFTRVAHNSFTGDQYSFKNVAELRKVTVMKDGKVLFVKYYTNQHGSESGSDVYSKAGA